MRQFPAFARPTQSKDFCYCSANHIQQRPLLQLRRSFSNVNNNNRPRGGRAKRASLTLSSAPESPKPSRTMEPPDPDATPRVLRVMNPDRRDGSNSVSSRSVSGSSGRLSLGSIAGSLSSIWGRATASRPQSELSQDLPPRRSSSFSTCLSFHRPDHQRAGWRPLVDGDFEVRRLLEPLPISP